MRTSHRVIGMVGGVLLSTGYLVAAFSGHIGVNYLAFLIGGKIHSLKVQRSLKIFTYDQLKFSTHSVYFDYPIPFLELLLGGSEVLL